MISPGEGDAWDKYQDAKSVLEACEDAYRKAMEQAIEARATWWAEVVKAKHTRPPLDP